MENKTGILLNHAYSLLDAFELTDPQTDIIYKLVRIRNPWGQTEWNGRWSDTSNEAIKYRNLLQDYVNNLEPDERFNIGDDDGTFFMLYEDWGKIFNKLYVALDFPDNWSGLRFSDEWDKSCAGGFPINRTDNEYKLWTTNPQYLIQINKREELEFFISLNQQDWRIIRGSKFPYYDLAHYIRIMIIPTTSDEPIRSFDIDLINKGYFSGLINNREVSLRVVLKKGSYILIP